MVGLSPSKNLKEIFPFFKKENFTWSTVVTSEKTASGGRLGGFTVTWKEKRNDVTTSRQF